MLRRCRATGPPARRDPPRSASTAGAGPRAASVPLLAPWPISYREMRFICGRRGQLEDARTRSQQPERRWNRPLGTVADSLLGEPRGRSSAAGGQSGLERNAARPFHVSGAGGSSRPRQPMGPFGAGSRCGEPTHSEAASKGRTGWTWAHSSHSSTTGSVSEQTRRERDDERTAPGRGDRRASPAVRAIEPAGRRVRGRSNRFRGVARERSYPGCERSRTAPSSATGRSCVLFAESSSGPGSGSASAAWSNSRGVLRRYPSMSTAHARDGCQ